MAELIAAAICNGSSQQLTAAVQKFGKDINKQTTFETYPLHLAVWRNSLTAIQQLLDAGASTGVRDGESGWSPLHKALYQGSLTAAALLLAHGSSMELLDNKGRLPLDLVSHDLKQQLHRAAAAAPTATAAGAAATNDAVGYSNLYSWGNGSNFTLGTGSTDLHLTPARVDINHPEAAAANTGSSSSGGGAAGSAVAAAAATPFAGRVVALAAAKFHSAIVTEDGRLFTFGFGRGGRLGHADFHIHSGSSAQIFPRAVSGLGKRVVVAVAAAKHHTLVATSAGEVFSFGSNTHGRLGYAAVDSQPTPRKVSSLPPRARVVSVAAANKHSAAVTSSGDVFTWGANSSGQLGYGTPDSGYNPTPRLVDSLKGKTLVTVAAAKRHTVVLTADGEVYTFGHKLVTPKKVLLAGSRDTARAAPPPPAGTLTTGVGPAAAAATPAASASSSSAGTAGATAASSSSSVVAADTSHAPAAAAAAVLVGSEQLVFHHGISDIVRPVAVAIAAGAAHTSALTRTGVVLVWPSAAPAPRALEVAGPLAGKRVVGVSAGKNRTAVVTDEGHVFMWESREGKRNKKKAPGEGGQQHQQGERGAGPAAAAAAAAAVGAGGRQDVDGVRKSGAQNTVAAAAVDGEGDKQQQQGAGAPGQLVAEKSSSSFTAGDTAMPMTASAGGGSSSSKVPASGSSHSQGPGSSSSSMSYGSHSTGSSSSNDAALRAMLKVWVGPTAPVVPVRVAGPRHVTAVAVGEKHSLALQTWVAPVLPEDSQQYSHMLQFEAAQAGSSSSTRHPLPSEGMGRSTVDEGALSDVSEHEEDEAYSAAADAAAAAGSSHRGSNVSNRWYSDAASHGDADGMYCTSSSSRGIGPESLSVICERAVAQQLVEPRTAPAILEYADVAGAHLLKAYCLSVAVRNLDMLIAEARYAFEAVPQHLLLEMEQLYKQLTLGEPASRPLQGLGQDIKQQAGEQTLAGQFEGLVMDARLINPGSADVQQQQHQGVAAAAAEARVPAYDLGFHFVIPGGEVFDTPEQQQEQEQGDQQQQQQQTAASVGGPPVPLQHIYKRLHHGRRPTNYPDRLTSSHPSNAAGSASDHSLLTAAAARGALAAVHRSWFEPDDGSQAAAPALGNSSFLSGDAERLTALREAAQKLHRNLLKKLQQIEALEARQAHGDVLDPQQMAKVSLKGSILDALGQLRAGSASLEDIQGLVARAQAVAQKLYLTPTAAAGDDEVMTGRSVGSYGPGSSGVMGTSPGEAAALNSLDGALSGAQTNTPSATATSQGPTASGNRGSSSTAVPTAAAASPSSSSKKGLKKAQQGLKGDLSMFLTGQLEKKATAAAAAAAAAATAAAAAAAREAAAASSSREASRGPAWGGVSLRTSVRPSLREVMEADVQKTPLTAAAAAAPSVAGASGASRQQPVTQVKATSSADAGVMPVSSSSSVTSSGAAVSSDAPSTSTSAADGATLPTSRHQQQQAAAGAAVTPVLDKGAASAPTLGSSSLAAPRTPRSIEHSSSSSSVGRRSSGLPPAGQQSGAAAAAAAAVGHHHVGLTPISPAVMGAAAGQAAPGSGIKLSLLDLVAHKRSSPLAVSRTKSKTGAGSGAGPAAAAAASGPAWGGVIGSSPPASSAVSLRDIQQEQEQLRATTGWAAYQREKAAAAATAAAPAAGSSSSSSAAAAGPSPAIQQLRAAGGLTKALQGAAAAVSSALPAAAASPAAAAAVGSSPGGGSLGVSYKGGSSYLLPGSSPPAPSKWYVRDQPQVRSLADIQTEEQLLQEQMQLLQQIEEEKALAEQQRRRQRQQQRKESRRAKLKDGADSSRASVGGGSSSSGRHASQQTGGRAGEVVVQDTAAAAPDKQQQQQPQQQQRQQGGHQPEGGRRGRGRGQGSLGNSSSGRSRSSCQEEGGNGTALPDGDGGVGDADSETGGVARPRQRHWQRHGRRNTGSDGPAADGDEGEQATIQQPLQSHRGSRGNHGRGGRGRSNRASRGDQHADTTAAAAGSAAEDHGVLTSTSAIVEANHSCGSTHTQAVGAPTPGARGRGSGRRAGGVLGGRNGSIRGQNITGGGDAAAATGQDSHQQWQPKQSVGQQATQQHGFS